MLWPTWKLRFLPSALTHVFITEQPQAARGSLLSKYQWLGDLRSATWSTEIREIGFIRHWESMFPGIFLCVAFLVGCGMLAMQVSQLLSCLLFIYISALWFYQKVYYGHFRKKKCNSQLLCNEIFIEYSGLKLSDERRKKEWRQNYIFVSVALETNL